MEDRVQFWVKINYVGEDTYKVLLNIFERVFGNKLNSIKEVKFSPHEKEIFIYVNHDLEYVLGCIYKDIEIESPDKDLITSIKVGIVGE